MIQNGKEDANFYNILVHSVLWNGVLEGGKIMSFLFSGEKGKSSIHAGFGIGWFLWGAHLGAHFETEIFCNSLRINWFEM